jgi:hypothetical protein
MGIKKGDATACISLNKSICREGGIRTHDLLHPMQARYRTALHPEIIVLQISFNTSTFNSTLQPHSV